MKVIKAIMSRFVEEAKKDRVIGLIKFSVWLRTEDGAIVYPWLFKEEYRELMIDIAYYYLKAFEKILGSLIRS